MTRKFIIILIGVLLAGYTWHVFSLEDTVVEDVSNTALIIDEEISGTLFQKMGASVALGVYLACVCVMYVLPAISEQISGLFYANPHHIAEEDVMRDARAFVAQGEFEGALAAYRHAAREEPENRLPWVEMAKIQVEHFKAPGEAAAIYAEALERREWPASDAAYFMFRISELQIEELDEKEAGIAALEQVVELFPGTRHAANANTRLEELEGSSDS